MFVKGSKMFGLYILDGSTIIGVHRSLVKHLIINLNCGI